MAKSMQKRTKREDVLKAASDQNVSFVRLWFTDVLGMLKSVEMTVDRLEDVLTSGGGFDGSSVEGYARIEESDVIAMPDPATFAILPWRAKDGSAVARMFCDVLTPEGDPYEGDPRRALRRNLERAKGMGYTCCVGPELEFFYFRDSKGTELRPK